MYKQELKNPKTYSRQYSIMTCYISFLGAGQAYHAFGTMIYSQQSEIPPVSLVGAVMSGMSGFLVVVFVKPRAPTRSED